MCHIYSNWWKLSTDFRYTRRYLCLWACLHLSALSTHVLEWVESSHCVSLSEDSWCLPWSIDPLLSAVPAEGWPLCCPEEQRSYTVFVLFSSEKPATLVFNSQTIWLGNVKNILRVLRASKNVILCIHLAAVVWNIWRVRVTEWFGKSSKMYKNCRSHSDSY